MIPKILTLISLSSINALSHGQSSFVFLGHDFSIRLNEDWGYCLFKKGKGYHSGDEVWVKKCGNDEEDGLFSENVLKAGKFQWSYNMESKQIESVGSVLNLDKFFCWTLTNLNDSDYEYKQRVTIVECYNGQENQMFNLAATKQIRVNSNAGICASVEKLSELKSGEILESPLVFTYCRSDSLSGFMARSKSGVPISTWFLRKYLPDFGK